MHISSIKDEHLDPSRGRDSQLLELFDIEKVEPECDDEYVKIRLDLPWKELENDVPLAFERYGWYGMVHRKNNEWNRSRLYGGLGLTFNPHYQHDLPVHAHGLGEPRSSRELTVEEWSHQTKRADYEKQRAIMNTYNDPLGLNVRTEVTNFRSFASVFDQLKFNMFQGRLAEIRPHEYDVKKFEENKEFLWHVDEENVFVSRILIPLVYSDDYYIEFQDTGTKLRFEPGYAYHWNTKRVHRWSFDFHEKIRNRTCIVLGFSPWITFRDNVWSMNEYANVMHPTDMIQKRIVI